ncbi:MFS transporter [Sphaerisporangium fuscum]|uniref:MFS transporter n=1 Tax=Sphaerisporangium fuscum TaxID=2835868 RepID=UPI001BDCFF43|nr:MFS transporter [Sphaerisporangium fuscum]
MYVSATKWPRLATVPGNVLALGAVSLVTDVSSEMVTAVLPLYLVLSLGLGPLAFGVIDGLYFGVTALVRLAGAHLADRRQRRKPVALAGYAVSAASRIGLLAAGTSVAALGAMVAADRAGKGLRTGPRDALISLSASPEALGQAFGVHRAMDTAGALLGPLVAFGVLAASGNAYDAVFVTSFCVGVLGVLLMVLYVQDRREPLAGERLSLRPVLRNAPLVRMCAAASALGLVTVSDAFVYLLLQKRLELAPELFPLLPLGTAAAFLLLAVPMGRLADRVGRFRVFLAGHAVLVVLYGLLALPGAGGWLVAAALLALGVFYAATDGVLMAAAGPLVPARLRTSGLALVQTGQAVGRLVSSMLFGALWTAFGSAAGLWVMGAGVAVCAVAAGFLLRKGARDA